MRRFSRWLHGDIGVSLVSALVTIVLLFLGGVLIYRNVEASMIAQVELQLAEEVVLFQALYENGGLAAVQSALTSLEDAKVEGPRLAGLFNAEGDRFAGNLKVAPERILFRSTTALVATPDGENLLETSVLFRGNTLVVARDVSFIAKTLSALRTTLVIAGSAVFASLTGLGFLLARSAQRKLARIEATLDAVGGGQTDTRVGLKGAGQIDRIGMSIDAALSRLSALIAASENTARGIAHELRTPLNRTYLMVQRAQEADDAERARLLEQIEAEIEGLERIIETMLEIGRLESGTTSLEMEVLDLSALAAEAVALFDADIAAKTQSLMLEAQTPVLIRGHRAMLLRLLVNLISNAHRYAPEGGHIVVRTRADSETGHLEVEDDGPGLPEDRRVDALKPLVRFGDDSQGTGLGLALVNAVAARHGARLDLTNTHPGLRVSVSFPAL